MKKLTKILLPLVLMAFTSTLCLAGDKDSVGRGVYIVQKGDCLWKIAAKKEVFGNSWQWPLFLEYNKALISDPNRLEVGATLVIPGKATAGQVNIAIKFAQDFPGPNEKKAVPAYHPFLAKKSESAVAVPKHEAIAKVEEKPAAPSVAEESVPAAAPAPASGFGSKGLVLVIGILLIVAALFGLGRMYRTPKAVPAAVAPAPAPVAPPVAPVQVATPAPVAPPAEEKIATQAKPWTPIAISSNMQQPAAEVKPEAPKEAPAPEATNTVNIPQPETPAPPVSDSEAAEKKHEDAA